MTNTEGFMTLEQAKALRLGEKLIVLCGGCGDVEDEGEMSFDAGEIVTVAHLDDFGDPQGHAVTIVAENGVVNVFDEADYGGLYPFKPLP